LIGVRDSTKDGTTRKGKFASGGRREREKGTKRGEEVYVASLEINQRRKDLQVTKGGKTLGLRIRRLVPAFRRPIWVKSKTPKGKKDGGGEGERLTDLVEESYEPAEGGGTMKRTTGCGPKRESTWRGHSEIQQAVKETSCSGNLQDEKMAHIGVGRLKRRKSEENRQMKIFVGGCRKVQREKLVRGDLRCQEKIAVRQKRGGDGGRATGGSPQNRVPAFKKIIEKVLRALDPREEFRGVLKGDRNEEMEREWTDVTIVVGIRREKSRGGGGGRARPDRKVLRKRSA